MIKQTLILTLVISLTTAGSSFAGKRGGFSFGGGSSKGSISKNFSGGSSRSSGSSFNNHSNNSDNHRFNSNSSNNNIRRITNGGGNNLHRGNVNTRDIKINHHGRNNHLQTQIKQVDVKKPVFTNPIKKHIDPHFGQHKKHEIKKHHIKQELIKHGVHKPHGIVKPICPPKGDCHDKPHQKPQVNVWWGCHRPVHCHTVIKVPCHPPTQEVVVEEPLAQVMVNTTIQLDLEGLSPEAGQVIVQIDQLSMPAEIVEWTPAQAKATIPMMALTGPMQATLHLVNADGSVAQSVNVELIPFNEQAVAAAP